LLSLNHFTRPVNFIKPLLFLARTADPHFSRERLPRSVYGLGLP